MTGEKRDLTAVYETIMQNTPDLIYVFDLKYRFIYANDALLKMWGRTWEESIGKGLLEIGYEPWHAEMHEREIDAVIATKKSIRGEVTFPHATLGKRIYDYIFVPVTGPGGTVESIAGTTRDITEIRKAEENLKESEERFRIFGNNIQNLAWIADGEGSIFWYNQRWLDYTGLSLEEMQGWGWQKVHHPDHVERILEIAKKLWVTNEPFELTFPLRRADGVYRWFLTRGVPVTDENGKIYQWIGTNTDINDRVEAEEKLKQSEQRYDHLIHSSPSGIGILYSEDLVITIANAPIIEIWGKGSGIIGKRYFEALPELAEQGYKEVFSQVYNTGIPFNAVETPVYILQNGKRILKYFNFILYPQRDINNAVNGIGIIATEVTTQAILNNKIKESEKRFRSMVEQAPVAICVLRGENYVVEVANEKQLELWGKVREEVAGIPIFTAIPEGAGQGFEALLAGVFTTGKAFIANEVPTTLIRRGRKETFYANFVYEPLYSSEGIIDGIMSVATDVTEQVTARKEIAESEERFRSLAQTLPQLVWVTDAWGKQEFASSRWKEYTGIEPGGEKEWKEIVHPQDYDGINAAWADSLATGNCYKGEVRLKNKDGEYRWHTVNGEPILDKENRIVKWVGAFTDINEQKIKEERKDEFISIASHEMRTPLTTAKAYLQILERSLDENSGNANLYANKASQAVNRLNELIVELLDVSKIRLGKLDYTITNFDFNEMIDSTVENIQLTSPSHVIIKSGKVYDTISGDKNRLQQVVINLLNNAIKYSPGAGKVFMTVEQENGTIKVAIRDMGIGISKESLARIFDKYHRVEEHAIHFQGLGIGLFISYEIVQRHHGRLWAESEQGKGSTFYFSVPISNV